MFGYFMNNIGSSIYHKKKTFIKQIIALTCVVYCLVQKCIHTECDIYLFLFYIRFEHIWIKANEQSNLGEKQQVFDVKTTVGRSNK